MRLLGRVQERQALDNVLDAVRAGVSGALVLRGDAGMGKTRLLNYAAESARDLRVARVAGIESESEFGYAALHRLVLPFVAVIDRLPERQRQALQSAFGLVAALPADRFLIGLGALTLLADVAAHQPLVCIVDDAQWIDRESLDAFAFVARRLHADRIALLFAVRDPADTQVPLDGLPDLLVEGLPDASALQLLTEAVSAPLSADVASRIVVATRGCPLAVTELAAELSSEQLAGVELLPEPLPIGARLEAHFLGRIRTLPSDTQSLLLIAAAETEGDYALVRRAAARLALDADAADVAVESRLLVTQPRVEFRHPLVRSAVYRGASASDRRRVHAALAVLVDAGSEPDRRVWHLAAAAAGPDEQIARDLEHCAAGARQRGRYGEEAALLSRAAELTPEPRHQARRLLSAAQAHLVAGARRTAERLVAQATPRLDDPLLIARAQRLQAALNSFTTPDEIPLVLLKAAAAMEQLDARLARDTYAEAIEACLVSCQLTKGTTPLEVARAALAAPSAPEPLPTLADVMLEGFATRLAVGYVDAVPKLREGVAALAAHDPDTSGFSRWAVFGNDAAADLWDSDAYRVMLRRLERTERAHGALDSLRITLGGLAHSEMWAGRFVVAEALHSEATEIALALGEDAAIWETLKVELFAWQGDDVKTRSAVAAITGAVADFGAGTAVNLALVASTILDIARGRYEEALTSAWPVYENDSPPQGSQVLPEIVEAAVRSGNRPVADAALERLTERARATATPWALGLLARSEALVAADAVADPLYQTAIVHLDRTGVETDLARAHLVYGEWLRRQKRRSDARVELNVAYEMFATMGAAAFAERARVELAATGAYARRRSVDTSNELTPQESQVARLAAEGATNREIAERMYLSESTVDYHLRKVYRKLGLVSRRQLRKVLS
jgi:DNA-binding CsgD family transcriptional regulator